MQKRLLFKIDYVCKILWVGGGQGLFWPAVYNLLLSALPYPSLPYPHLPSPPQLYSTQLNPPLPLALPSPLPALSNPSLPSLYPTLPYLAVLNSTPLYSSSSLLLFPPLAALPSHPLLSPFTLPYSMTLHSTIPYTTILFSLPSPYHLSQPTPHHSTLPSHPLPFILPYSTPFHPCTISYPALLSSPPYP